MSECYTPYVTLSTLLEAISNCFTNYAVCYFSKVINGCVDKECKSSYGVKVPSQSAGELMKFVTSTWLNELI